MGTPAAHSGKRLFLVARCGGFWLCCREPPVVLAVPELGVQSLLETGVEQIAAVCGQRYECWVLLPVEGAVSGANGAVNVGDVLTAAFTVCEL